MGKIYATLGSDNHFNRWNDDGTGLEIDLVSPTESADFPVFGQTSAGGSDGAHHWLFTTASGSTHIDKINRDFTTRLDVFPTTPSPLAGSFGSATKHVSAGRTRIVMQYETSTTDEVSVFIMDHDGNVLDTWTLTDAGTMSQTSAGATLDRTEQFLYFTNYSTAGGDPQIVKVDLSDGSWSVLPITVAGVDTAVGGSWPGQVEFRGIVELGGELIVAGQNRTLIRVEQDGTLVWSLDRSAEGGEGGGVALTANRLSVWLAVADYPDDAADRATVGGVYEQTLAIPSDIASPRSLWGDPFSS